MVVAVPIEEPNTQLTQEEPEENMGLIKMGYQQQALNAKCRACKNCKFVYSRPIFGLFDP
ncbi:hypothetical protein N7497_011309 [Penicillium chrysogenum]|nr:hypothetical protein N7497_011309 [Penicillium chrysogenum]